MDKILDLNNLDAAQKRFGNDKDFKDAVTWWSTAAAEAARADEMSFDPKEAVFKALLHVFQNLSELEIVNYAKLKRAQDEAESVMDNPVVQEALEKVKKGIGSHDNYVYEEEEREIIREGLYKGAYRDDNATIKHYIYNNDNITYWLFGIIIVPCLLTVAICHICPGTFLDAIIGLIFY